MVHADAVVVGAGVIGAFCARELARAGMSVRVLERASVGGGTTGAGEGNILVSDKDPGPELLLALHSVRLWRQIAPELPGEIELDLKGGIVVATTADGERSLGELARGQNAAGVTTETLDPAECTEREPLLTRDVIGGVFYPQDMQVMPVLATAAALRDGMAHGATVHTGTTVTGIDRDRTGVRRVHSTEGEFTTRVVVNAAGAAAGDIAALAGSLLPIQPRRGFILVTEPLGEVIAHKVYDADYVANVASSEADLATSTVVESTRSGTVLIGASRERVGYDRTMRYDVLDELARRAVRLFPFLGPVRAMRAYRGFRPYCPDHLPVIGADPEVGGLFHAAGHEGAGIGLAPATAAMIRALVTDATPELDPVPYALDRPTLRGAPA